jgi:hypothetical protein
MGVCKYFFVGFLTVFCMSPLSPSLAYMASPLRTSQTNAAICQRVHCTAKEADIQDGRPTSALLLEGTHISIVKTQQAPACGPRGNRKPWGTPCSPIGICNGKGVCCGRDDTGCLGPPPR